MISKKNTPDKRVADAIAAPFSMKKQRREQQQRFFAVVGGVVVVFYEQEPLEKHLVSRQNLKQIRESNREAMY